MLMSYMTIKANKGIIDIMDQCHPYTKRSYMHIPNLCFRTFPEWVDPLCMFTTLLAKMPVRDADEKYYCRL